MSKQRRFSGPLLAQICDVPYQTINMWARDGLLVPSLKSSTGRGSRRLYTPANAIAVDATKKLRAHGAPGEVVRSVVEYINSGPVAAYLNYFVGKRIKVSDAEPTRLKTPLFVGTDGSITELTTNELPDALRRAGGVGYVLDLGALACALADRLPEELLIAEVEESLMPKEEPAPRKMAKKERSARPREERSRGERSEAQTGLPLNRGRAAQPTSSSSKLSTASRRPPPPRGRVAAQKRQRRRVRSGKSRRGTRARRSARAGPAARRKPEPRPEPDGHQSRGRASVTGRSR